MRSSKHSVTVLGLCALLIVPAVCWGAWGQINRDMDLGLLWDTYTNRHYGGANQCIQWPGGPWNRNDGNERHTLSNYRGFVLGARNVVDAENTSVIWPYMVAQRDGWNDGEKGAELNPTPDPNMHDTSMRFMYNGRLVRRTFRQPYPVVTVDGAVVSPAHITVGGADGPYQDDVIDPNISADLQLETKSWTRMGVSPSRVVYQFVDRRADDFMFWHYTFTNDGEWGLNGDRMVAQHTTVQELMFSIMLQWDRNGWGGNFTASNGENNNDTIWNYYGHDYYDYAVNSVGTADDMRLVWVRDGDQSQAKYNAPHGKQDDYGDPHPITGELMSARDGGLLTLHWDTDVDDPRDDAAQPLQVGWVNYNHNTRTGVEGHAAKYNQIRYGLQQDGTYHPGPEHPTPGRPAHPNGAAWIRPSNDPAVSSTYWPGKVLGVDWEVTDVEQNFGFGPFTLDPNESLHGVFAVGAGGVDVERCRDVGARWLAGQLTDAQKNEVVFSARDSLFRNMRTAKAIYESKTFPTGQGGMRYASTRSEFEEALQAAVAAGTLSLSPPAPATFDVRSGPDQGELSWTVNTGVNTTYTGFRLYRALAGYKGDSTFTLIYDGTATSYTDPDVKRGFSYYYYLTTYDDQGNESTLWTRTTQPMIPYGAPVNTLSGAIRVVPNPWCASDMSQQYAGRTGNAVLDSRSGYSRIQFVNLPGQCTIRIYTVDGDLVKTIDHEEVVVGDQERPSGNETWNLISDSNQYVVSGIYIFVVETSAGDNEVGKFIIIR